MCLVALALDAHQRYPLVVAANRDEYHARATEPLQWWTPASGGPDVLGGRDLVAGGTWLGLTRAGRVALLTNIRAPGAYDPSAPSRGRIVTDWLASPDGVEAFWARVAARRHNGFNLVIADLAAPAWFWASSNADTLRPIPRGLHALSNAALDTPWPKTEQLKARLHAALDEAPSLQHLAQALFDALADPRPAADADLPMTGMPIDAERVLSSAFVEWPERGYGTRCSTLIVTERLEHGQRTHVFERSYGAPPARATALRHHVLEGWPPRPGSAFQQPATGCAPSPRAESPPPRKTARGH